MVLLFDDAKKLEKAVGAEAAEVIAHVFEKQDLEYKKSLATKAKIELKTEIKSLEARLIQWVAGLLVVQAASIVALVKLLG